ncbi:MAG: acyltransferase family protein [Arenimonas sp.]
MNSRPNKKNLIAAPTEALNAKTQTSWPSLTGIRGLAAIWVLLLHTYLIAGNGGGVWPPFAWVMAMGGMGVDIFFTLSAFLLSMPFAEAIRQNQPHPDLGGYARRRFFRIFPAYYSQVLLVMCLAALGVGVGMPWSSPTMGGMAAHAVLWINAWPLIPAYVPTWWTLPVEFGFYLLLPWLAKCLTDRRWYWLLLGIAFSLLYRHLLLGLGLSRAEEVYWVDHLPGRLFQFLIGMLAAYFFVRLREQKKLPGQSSRNLMIVFSTLIFLSLPALGWLQGGDIYHGAPSRHPVLAFWHLYASICVAVILIGVSSGQNFFDIILQSMPLQWLGRISYGVYLWHYPVLVILRETMGGMQATRDDFANFFISGFLISITLAFLSWHWLEAPILKRVGSGAA